MPVIRISDDLYERLQKHATPFIDTPATVIERILDAYESGRGGEREPDSQPTQPNSGEHPMCAAVPKIDSRQERRWEVTVGQTAIPCYTKPHPTKTGEFVRVEIFGFRLTHILLALRDAGYSFTRVRGLLDALDLREVYPNTIRNYLNPSRPGTPAALLPHQLAALEQLAPA